MARKMVCQFGMSDKLGHITFGQRNGLIFLGRDLTEERNYSEDTAKKIDEEVHKIIDECFIKAKALLVEHRDKLDLLARTLLEKEVLDADEVRKLLGFQDKKEKQDSPQNQSI